MFQRKHDHPGLDPGSDERHQFQSDWCSEHEELHQLWWSEKNYYIQDWNHIAVEIRNFEFTAFSSADDQFFSGLWVVVVSNKCSASTTESTIPFAKKFSWYKKKNMAHRRSIYKAKTNSFIEKIGLGFGKSLYGNNLMKEWQLQNFLTRRQCAIVVCTPNQNG